MTALSVSFLLRRLVGSLSRPAACCLKSIDFWPWLIQELLAHSCLILVFPISIRADVLLDMEVDVPQPMGPAFSLGDRGKCYYNCDRPLLMQR